MNKSNLLYICIHRWHLDLLQHVFIYWRCWCWWCHFYLLQPFSCDLLIFPQLQGADYPWVVSVQLGKEFNAQLSEQNLVCASLSHEIASLPILGVLFMGCTQLCQTPKWESLKCSLSCIKTDHEYGVLNVGWENKRALKDWVGSWAGELPSLVSGRLVWQNTSSYLL